MRLSIITITKGKWWKIYLIILVIFTALGVIDFISENLFERSQIIMIVINLISLVGLLGYIFQSPILSKYVWAIVFLLNIMALLYTFYNISLNWTDIREIVSLSDIVVGYGFAFVLSVPLFFALYYYSFNSPNIWSKVNGNTNT